VLDTILTRDPDREKRQLGIVDASGASASFTGGDCTGWAGQLTGPDYAIQGNMLTGEATLAAMEAAFLSTAEKNLPERLVRSLESGQRGGGDKRGKQSAALLVFHEEAYPYIDLRVDEHADPVAELRRVWEVAQHQLLPYVDTMPTRDKPEGRHDQAVVDLILLPTAQRAARRTTPRVPSEYGPWRVGSWRGGAGRL
jgi:uncharacterized Ntn-hydrolase superfamily protein